jgi:hypothetical protein
MGVKAFRYVARAVPGRGWRIWNRKTKRWWGNFFVEFPSALLDELNGPKRPEEISKLSRRSKP